LVELSGALLVAQEGGAFKKTENKAINVFGKNWPKIA
jgi:hypothetical protein